MAGIMESTSVYVADRRPPAVILDTSALVNAGRRDYGFYSSLIGMCGDLTRTFPDADPKIIILDSVNTEYENLYGRNAKGEYGLPKASFDVLRSRDAITEFPARLNGGINEIYELWRRTSKKASRGGRLSRADAQIMALATDYARDGRACCVMSYDEDIKTPLLEIKKEYPNLRVAEESALTADRVVYVLGEEGEPILLPPGLAGTLL